MPELVQGIQRLAAVGIHPSEFVLALLRSLRSVAGSRADPRRRVSGSCGQKTLGRCSNDGS